MIIRVVKMVFKPEEIESFKKLFDERKHLIRNFESCAHLELWQDKTDENIFFTYSWWHSEEELNNYRNSHFFDDTWLHTKQKFIAKPEAWSVSQLHTL